MKQLLVAVAALATIGTYAQDLPQPSPKAEVEQVVGLTDIEIEYSRPSARGRKVFGDLVPYGKVWRTGANLCTTIEVDGPISFGGEILEPGKYSLFTVPNDESWLVILNSNTELWGEGDRKEEEDVLKVKVPAKRMDRMQETFEIGFDEVKDDRAVLQLRWEYTVVSIPIGADATKQALTNIEAAMKEKDADFRVYHNSARFLVDRNMMPKEALAWAQTSVKMEKRFWNVYTLALAYAQNDRMKEAIATAEECRELAKKAEYEPYIKMANERIAEWGKGSMITPGLTPKQ